MRIALLINYVYPDAGGGTSVYVRTLADALVRGGHDVEVFSCTKDRRKQGAVVENGVTYRRTYLRSGDLGPLRFGNRRRFAAAFMEHASRFDIVNIQGVGLLPGRFLGDNIDRIVLTAHASLKKEIGFDISKQRIRLFVRPWLLFREALKYAYVGMMERSMFRRVPRVIVMSRYVKEYLGRMYPGTYLRNASVIPIGTVVPESIGPEGRLAARRGIGVPDDTVQFFTIRRLVPRMGLENLVQAFALLEGLKGLPPCRLAIAGKGPLRDSLQRLISTSGVGGRVVLTGYLSDEEKAMHFRGADCFVLPTEELEGFGIVTLEALSYGLPVIGTPTGATPEILQHFNPELITDGCGPRHIAERLRLYLEAPGRFRGNADRTAELFGWQKIIPVYEKVYRGGGR